MNYNFSTNGDPKLCVFSAGVVHADLKLFLETNLPSGGKKKTMLGVSDAKLGAALQEELQLSIQTGGVVAEIIRGELLFKKLALLNNLEHPTVMMQLDRLISDALY